MKKISCTSIVKVVLSICLCVSFIPVSAVAETGVDTNASESTSESTDAVSEESTDASVDAGVSEGGLKEAVVDVSADAADESASADTNAFGQSTMSDEEIAEIVNNLVASTDDDTDAATDASDSGDTDELLSLGALETQSSVSSSIAGTTRYETSAQEALVGWPDGVDTAILACGEAGGWADALSASSLAGVLDCPILLTPTNSLDSYIAEALVTLGVKKVIIVGGTAAVSKNVADEVCALSCVDASKLERLSGDTRFDTQIKIYERGIGLWSSDMVIVTRGGGESGFADALSASPLAYTLKVPVFITDGDATLTTNQKSALIKGAKQGLFKKTLILGGDVCVSGQTEGFMWAVSQISSGNSKASERIYGSDRYATSVKVATWAIKKGYLQADNAAFASGSSAWDALGGGALQGKQGSVLILVSEDSAVSNAKSLSKVGSVSQVKFLGGTGAVSTLTRSRVLATLGLVDVTYKNYDITLDNMVSLEQVELASKGYTDAQLRSSLSPSCSFGDDDYYQYAILSDGYSGKVTAEELDAFIAKQVVFQEQNYGVTSALRGSGAYIIEAARTYNVNEVYLLAHAALESAWGCSALAQGSVSGYAGYRNFFGIGAYDLDPNNGGAALAKREGWSSVESALLGAAKWISNNYLNPTVSSAAVSGEQNTLYKMKWDVQRAVSEGSVWHQYATGRTWASGIASVMANCYSYLGMSMANTGLRFEVPVYK